MKTYTEILRSISDYLGLSTNLIFVEFDHKCNANYYALARDRFPTAHFISIGTCTKANEPRFSTAELSQAVSSSMSYANKGAHVVLSYGVIRPHSTPNRDAEIFANVTRDFIDGLYNQYKLRPVIIHQAPADFLHDTNIPKEQVTMVRYRIPHEKIIDQLEEITSSKPLLFSRDAIQVADAFILAIFLYQLYKICAPKLRSTSSNRNKLKVG